MPPPPKIVVFDSGAGGLSVAREILLTLPSCHLTYVADNAFFPYGLKEDSALSARIVSQISALYARQQPDIVVLACNTASTLALDILRARFDCPFVGVVPAIKPAAILSKSKVIGVLATPATVARPYTQRLIAEFAQGVEVLLHGSDTLVELAEKKYRGEVVDGAAVYREISRLFDQPHGDRIDAVVLACTHFPLLKQEMIDLLAQHQRAVDWVDSGNAIARRVLDLLGAQQRGNGDAPIAPLRTTENAPTRIVELAFSDPTLIIDERAACYLHYLNQAASE